MLITKSSISPVNSAISPTTPLSVPIIPLILLKMPLITAVKLPRIVPMIPPTTFSTRHSVAFKILSTRLLRILAIISSRFLRIFAMKQVTVVNPLSIASLAIYLADNGTLPVT